MKRKTFAPSAENAKSRAIIIILSDTYPDGGKHLPSKKYFKKVFVHKNFATTKEDFFSYFTQVTNVLTGSLYPDAVRTTKNGHI